MQTFDLHVRLPSKNTEMEVGHLMKQASTLGFDGLAIDSLKPFSAKNYPKNLELLHRFTFTPRNASRLRFHVNKHLKQVDLLIIHGRTKPIWLAAAQIPDVHMILLREIEDFQVIDSQVARALAKQDKPIEICLHRLLTHTGSLRSRLIRVMHTALDHIIRADCKLILTSGATHSCELRAPKDLEALSYLASVPEEIAKMAMNQWPRDLISSLQTSSRQNTASSRRESQ
jgi:RNase P/RNase MRP subunit p30